MATMIVGISSEVYRRTRERLESRNRELEANLEHEAAQRVDHERELQQGARNPAIIAAEINSAGSRIRD